MPPLLSFYRLKPNPSSSFPQITTTRTMQQQKHVSAGEGIAADVGGRSGGGGLVAGGCVSVCRPSGSRWTPTPGQLKILKELYYGCGVRSPTAEQIQRITGMLRQHGKIEGKNVFYWFQNHKARERQKKRLTNLDVNTPAAGAEVNHLGILSLSPSGATSPSSSTLGMYTTGNGGVSSAMQLDTAADWDNTAMAMATEGCFLQDYMGVRSTGGGGHGGTGVATSPWAWFSSSGQRPKTTRAPEMLPFFPTSDDDNHQRPPWQGGRGGGSYYHADLSFRGAAPAPAATTTTIVTIQQHQLLQMQQQYSFYSSSNELPSHETQDTTAGAGASLELSLSSSWCSPYHAGAM